MKNEIIEDFKKHFDFSVVQLQENDVVILTFDTEVFNIETCEQIYKEWQNAFPNNDILCKFSPMMEACIVRDLE